VVHSKKKCENVLIFFFSRRGAESSGDIDILLTHPNYTENNKKDSKIFDKIVNKLKDNGYITDDISFGSVKYMGVCKLTGEDYIHRRIDLR
jgi:DNA polymerase beta